jgi:hypothetical protein
MGKGNAFVAVQAGKVKDDEVVILSLTISFRCRIFVV